MKIHRINKSENNYPKRLLRLSDPPKKINILGDLNPLLQMPTLAIVGSRKVTAYGRMASESFSETIARSGICVVSGLALGVDSIAHRSALKAKGKTITVLPSGLKDIYPASHRQLAKDILTQDGALISEYDDNFRPRRESFIQRNRIIAALADVLLVTEAAERSGSLYTANFALEMGKTVLAVPGNINSPNSQGTNRLIKAGALMATNEQDIFDALHITPEQSRLKLYGDDKHESQLLQLLEQGVSSGDELLAQSQMSIQLFQKTLTMLEIKGAVAPLGNNHWRLK